MDATLRSLVLGVCLTGGATAQFAELAKLKASDAAAGDQFGVSVSLSGGRALVGALADDDLGADAGAAYVFERQADGTWLQVAKLRASDGAVGDLFGYWVSLDGDRALVSALFDDDLGPDSGSAYVFERSGGAWREVAKLLAGDGTAGDWFGSGLEVEGDRALIGAQLDTPGSAYVFERQPGGDWLETAKLVAADGFAGNIFGHGVSLHGDRALVGAYADGATAGAAYVFERQAGGGWQQAAKLTASDAAVGKQFGFAVSLGRETALVGAGGQGITGLLSGSAYVFERTGAGAWVEVAHLLDPDVRAGDGFGFAVSLGAQQAVVSDWADDGPLPDSGAAWVFERQPSGEWQPTAHLLASEPAAGDGLGYSLATLDDRVLAGAWGFTGGDASGAAYLFDLQPLSSPVTLVPVGAGGAQPLSLQAGHLHAGQAYLLVGSASGTSPGVPLAGGLVLPLNPDAYFAWSLANPNQPPLAQSSGRLGPAGQAMAAFVLPPGAPASLVGITLDHAFVTLGPLDFVSNPLPVLLAP